MADAVSSLLHLLPETARFLRRERPPVIVTGAGGWLGRAALDLLDALPDPQILAFSASAREFTLRSGRRIVSRPLTELAGLDVSGALVLHFAFLTKGHASTMPLADYVAANTHISGIVRGFLERNGARGLFLPSSGAVYRRDGALDDELAANPYGVLKLADERGFGTLCARLGIPAAILRIFNLSGPFINNQNSYALSSIIADIQAGGPVRVRAARPVVRSYVQVGDVLNVAIGILLAGRVGGAFDTAGEIEIEVGDLARRALRVLEREDIRIERPPPSGEAADRYVGDGRHFAETAAALGLGLRTLDRQIADTAAFMKASRSG